MNPHNLSLDELVHAIDIGPDNPVARALVARIDEIREEAGQTAKDLQGELDSLRAEYNDEEARADKYQKELYALADATDYLVRKVKVLLDDVYPEASDDFLRRIDNVKSAIDNLEQLQ